MKKIRPSIRARMEAIDEQRALEKRWRAEKEARIRKVLAEEPDLHPEALMERFGLNYEALRHIAGGGLGKRWEPEITRDEARRALAPGWMPGLAFNRPKRTA